MGSRLATELLGQIARAGQAPTHVILETELVVRESA
jgi:DNA-binding LacI/PurR family transcriptional regulator